MAANGLVTNLQSRPASHALGISTKPHGQTAQWRVPLGPRVPASTIRQTLIASNGAPISSVVSNLPQSIARDGSVDAEEVDDISLPDELVSLSQLVKQLAEETSKSSDADVVKLKQAFGELAEDLKQKIAETSAIPTSATGASFSMSPVTIRGYKNAAKWPMRVSPVTTNVADVESDLDGLIPSQAGVLPSIEDKQVIDRDMVRARAAFTYEVTLAAPEQLANARCDRNICTRRSQAFSAPRCVLRTNEIATCASCQCTSPLQTCCPVHRRFEEIFGATFVLGSSLPRFLLLCPFLPLLPPSLSPPLNTPRLHGPSIPFPPFALAGSRDEVATE